MLQGLYQVTNQSTKNDEIKNISNTLKKNDLISRQAFLRLFIEQLKNQDPLNPMKNYELSAQLAQFSSLEQLYNINNNFKEFKNELNKEVYIQGINLIGKKIQYIGNEIYKSGDNPIEIKFKIDDNATNGSINIYDEKDNLVKTLKVNNLTKGENFVTWDGTDINGNKVPDGIYKYELIAYNDKGDQINYTGYGSGPITSLRFDPDTNNAIFKVNNEEITLDKIISIFNNSNNSTTTLSDNQGKNN